MNYNTPSLDPDAGLNKTQIPNLKRKKFIEAIRNESTNHKWSYLNDSNDLKNTNKKNHKILLETKKEEHDPYKQNIKSSSSTIRGLYDDRVAIIASLPESRYNTQDVNLIVNNNNVRIHKNEKKTFYNKKRGLLQGIQRFFGVEPQIPPPVQVLKFMTTVTNVSQFKNSLEVSNKTVANFLLNISKSTVSDISQVQGYELGSLMATQNLSISLNVNQLITVIDTSKITVNSMQTVISQLTSEVLTDIMTDFGNQTISALKTGIEKNDKNNLLNSIFSVAPPSMPFINQIVDKNTNITNVISNDIKTIINNVTSTQVCQEFVFKLQQTFKQELQFRIQNASAQNIKLDFSANQNVDLLLKSVKKLEIHNKIFSTLSNSQVMGVDTTVINATKDDTDTQQKSTVENEKLAETVNSVGTSIGSAAQGIGSGVGLAGLGVFSPLIIGGIALVALLGVYLFTRNSNKTNNVNRSSSSFKKSEEPNLVDFSQNIDVNNTTKLAMGDVDTCISQPTIDNGNLPIQTASGVLEYDFIKFV